MTRRRFVLIDRDGTIIVERGYLSDPQQVELLPGAVEGLKQLQERGFGLALVTNQSAIGRGFFDEARLTAIHDRLTALLASDGIYFDGIFFCPHTPDDNCECRKPRTGLAERAAAALGFELAASFVIGDKVADIEMGRWIGATTILVRTGYGAELAESGAANPDHVASDLTEAAELIQRAADAGR